MRLRSVGQCVRIQEPTKRLPDIHSFIICRLLLVLLLPIFFCASASSCSCSFSSSFSLRSFVRRLCSSHFFVISRPPPLSSHSRSHSPVQMQQPSRDEKRTMLQMEMDEGTEEDLPPVGVPHTRFRHQSDDVRCLRVWRGFLVWDCTAISAAIYTSFFYSAFFTIVNVFSVQVPRWCMYAPSYSPMMSPLSSHPMFPSLHHCVVARIVNMFAAQVPRWCMYAPSYSPMTSPLSSHHMSPSFHHCVVARIVNPFSAPHTSL